MAEDEKKNRAQRRQEERDQARQAQIERDTETIVNTTPSPVTAVDGLGVERIITTIDGTYTAAATDPDPKEVERLANLQTRMDEKKAERLGALSSVGDGGGETARKAIEAEAENPAAGAPTPSKPADVAPAKTPAGKPAKLP